METSLQAARLPAPCVDNLPSRVAGLLADGRIVMWFQGAMEYGPRALGHRSVLARPDRPDLRDRLNLALRTACVSAVLSQHAGMRLPAGRLDGSNRSMTMA
jgi:carbamoyltransferase